MKFGIIFLISFWCIINNCNGNNDDDCEKDSRNNVDDSISNVAKPRKKRFFELPLLWCMNFPDCCDIRGKDLCGFACPVCPIKTDMCKFVNFMRKAYSSDKRGLSSLVK